MSTTNFTMHFLHLSDWSLVGGLARRNVRIKERSSNALLEDLWSVHHHKLLRLSGEGANSGM